MNIIDIASQKRRYYDAKAPLLQGKSNAFAL